LPRATRRGVVIAAAAAVLWSMGGGALSATQRQVEVHAGRWLGSQDAMIYQLRNSRHLTGPLSHGLTLSATISDTLGRRRAFYGVGYDLLLFRQTRGLAPYGLLGVALGLSTDVGPQQLAAQWMFGGGLEWRPASFFGVSLEARYRVEDRGPEGFWAATDVRKGMSWTAGAAVSWRRNPSSADRDAAASRSVPMATAARAPATVAGPAGNVVTVALDALGTPYRWGGTAENGFDCSGLVQWAYAQHGIQLPRMSRAQATSGAEVPPVVDALAPGDILLFAAQPGGGVTHVGLYAGEGKFIHSSSNGVRLSVLDHSDSNGSYWMRRWVGARRIIP
jgi:cell wall-associated NlpC family hydrolase